MELTFQDGSQNNRSTDMQRRMFNIIRNLNLDHIRTDTEHYHYAERKSNHMRHIMFAKIRNLIENTPRSPAMPGGTDTFAV